MAEFEAKVYELKIEEHPNADLLELAVVGDYRSIVRKGDFKTGDLGVYIPEGAVCPDWLIASMGLEGKLAGPLHNRVKAVKLRKVLSQGLIYPVTEIVLGGKPCPCVGRPIDTEIMVASEKNLLIGNDATEFLGLTKYEPPIPTHMSGEVFNAHGYTLHYDIENVKKFPYVLQREMVMMTEKLHGTWCCFGYHPEIDTPIVTSKGMSAKGLAFKFNLNNADNLYVQAFNGLTYRDINREGLFKDILGTTILDRAAGFWGADKPFYILGEIYGKGVQDLTYGTNSPQFRVFDIYWGNPGEGIYADAITLPSMCKALELEMVPVLYEGIFSGEKMEEFTNGREEVSGDHANIREGVVIKPYHERHDVELGRVALKSISELYLLRKGGTELN